MMDDSSLFIHYESRRNECIDCFKCVSVCPTGIDIRNGVQMECIACTACVDACDSVMEKMCSDTALPAGPRIRQR
jgi:polyferredoxin